MRLIECGKRKFANSIEAAGRNRNPCLSLSTGVLSARLVGFELQQADERIFSYRFQITMT